MTIWKYVININDNFTINLPDDSLTKILSLQIQRNQPCLWILVDDTAKVFKERKFRIVGTGIPVNFNTDKFIGTFQINYGNLVFHLFEVTE